MEIEFKAWPKIPRGDSSTMLVTEKMDGTNSCVIVQDGKVVGAQSRNKLIYPVEVTGDKGSDNYGFAAWVKANADELSKLGDGYHYGEWVGPSINGNNHALDSKKFYLFNAKRWGDHNPNTPDCCNVVPILAEGKDIDIGEVMAKLKESSVGKYEPEGVIVYKDRSYSKYTFKFCNGKWAG